MEQISPIFREKIDILERAMINHRQVELPIVHYFANGLYAREMHVPKDVLIVGMIHTTETINILSKGKMVIWNEDGTKSIVEAPFTHSAKPGIKRVGYVLEDVVWVTIHKTDLTDLREIEKEQFIVGDNNMFDFATGKVKDKVLQDRRDFDLMLKEYGYTHEVVQAQSENLADRIEIDLDGIGVAIGDSLIHNKGIIAKKHFKKGEIIGVALVRGLRTQLGRYVNHSCDPNAEMVKIENNMAILRCLKDISDEEITTDYRHTLSLSGILPVKDGGRKCLE